jgi:large subunit ribosomal protein L35
MPKQKTHSGLKKRIKITGTGKISHHHAYTGHNKVHKTHKQNVALHKAAIAEDVDYKRLRPLISNML